MALSKELLNRRIPQILASYFIAGATFILFMDWVVDRYGLAEYYTTMALFGVITILPSVIILSYFHGAPGKDQWNRIEKIGIPVNMIFIILVFFIGHKGNWWFESDYVIENNNYYVNFTSSENYLKYFDDNYFPSYAMEFGSDKYLIKSMPDSLMDDIKISLYRSISGAFAGQDINVEVNISKEESELFDQLYHPALNPLTDYQKDTLSRKMDDILNILNKNYIYYDDHLPNIIIRYFIYEITDLETNEKFYSYQKSINGGETLRTHSYYSYSNWSKKYFIDEQSMDNLIEDLGNSAIGQINAKKYGWTYGEIIEELDHDLVKIKQYHPGAIKKKMRLKTVRRYVWEEDGLNIMLEDIMQLVDYLKNTEPQKIWDYGQTRPDSDWANKLKVYDETEFKKEIDAGISSLIKQIQTLKEKRAFFQNSDSSTNDTFEYYLEVVSVEDSIVIAKIIGSVQPVYTVREGDMILISK